VQTRCPRFSGSGQLRFQLRDQFTHRFAERAPTVIEYGVPIGQRILVHGTPLPAPRAGNGGDEVGSDASLDFHELRIPINFLDGWEAAAFFAAFAFGLRTSLLGRFCPLAILCLLDHACVLAESAAHLAFRFAAASASRRLEER